MNAIDRKILIIDEHDFSRVCSAILRSSGYMTEIITQADDLPGKLNEPSCGLVVTSYPFGKNFFEYLGSTNIPIIVLSDEINEGLISLLSNFQNSCCMIKPVDYDEFRSKVKQGVNGVRLSQGGAIIA